MLKTFGKFILVGSINGIIYFALLYFLTSVLGMYYMWSAVISVIVQTLITFALHRAWTWGSKKGEVKSVTTIYRFIKYLIVGGVGMVFGLMGLYIVTEVWHVHYMLSTIIASAVLLVLNFLANNYWTWGNNESRELNWIVSVLERLGLVPLIKRLGVQI
jgi:putative flippase GtrA